MKLSAISLYTGIGGLDFGFEAAGFRTRAAVEIDSVCVRNLRKNRRWPVIDRSIHEIPSEEILDVACLDVGDADVLIGGPPCQPFSKSSYWVNGDTMRLDDPRADTLGAFLRVLRDVQPRSFLLENVHGLAFKNKDEGLQLLLRGIQRVNREAGTSYSIRYAVLNAADYGVPQIRTRVFLVGSRDNTEFVFPAPTHGDHENPTLLSAHLEAYRTAWDAIGGLEIPSEEDLTVRGTWGDLLPSIPEGKNYLWHTPRGGGKPLFGWRTRYWSFLLKLAKSLPSWTIQANPGSAIGPFHWDSRKLSTLELCRLQTFPDGLDFDCGRTHVQRMLGNAVPSLLAETLALEIRRQLLGTTRRGKGRKLLPPGRTDCPPPKRIRSVPRKYLRFVGDHADHPGEGRGPASRQRLAQR